MLEIHFLNVGHGDCTIIRHPSGRLTMLDINNGQLLDAGSIAEERATPAPAHHSNSLFSAGIGGALGAAATNSFLGSAERTNRLTGSKLEINSLLAYALASTTPSGTPLEAPRNSLLPSAILGAFGKMMERPSSLLGSAGTFNQRPGLRTEMNALFATPGALPSGVGVFSAVPYCPPPPYARGGITTLLGQPAAYRSDLVNPIAYLDQFFPNEPIHRYIQTHPDLDHMRGLARLLRSRPVINFWHPQDTKAAPTFQDEEDRADWNAYQDVRAGRYPTINVLSPLANALFWPFERNGLLDGDGIQVLSPTQDLVTGCNSRNESNDISYVVALDYGGRRIVLGGDAEATAWQDMVDRYGQNLFCWVLKASHHGRDSGYHGPALDMLAPDGVIVSVGKKPDTDAHAKYKRRGADVRSTRRHGTIVLSVLSDGTHSVQYR